MKRTLVLTLLAAAFVSPAQSAQALNIGQCVQYTSHPGLNTRKVTTGLPITGDQVREIRGRLSNYSGGPLPDLSDLGLPADVIAEIGRRVALQVAQWHPAGWPCPAFKAPAKTKSFLRKLLLANGYDTADLKIRLVSPRQFQFSGYKGNIQVLGAVAKSEKRKLVIKTEIPSGPVRTSYISTPFEA